jgi:hypothetical protein
LLESAPPVTAATLANLVMTVHSENTSDLLLHNLEARLGALFDDPDFLTIHRRISPFNLFEAVGAIRAELRHSNFLAYLLSPSRPHGLGARPLAAVLRAILMRLPASQRPVMTLEMIAGDLDDAVIHRERDNIDILVELRALKFVVAIENKVGARASDGQLERYSKLLGSAFPEYRKLLVFLTPDGSQPGHDQYVAYDYASLAETLETLVADGLEPVPAETSLIIRHYVDMVRRHIVQDDLLRALALTLYERHKEAFEFIFECRPEPRSLLTVVRECVQSVQGLTEDSSGSHLFRFLPEVWDERLTTIKGDPAKWSKTGRGILFEGKTYANAPGRVNISLILGPGDPAMRSRVYQAAVDQPQLFTGLAKPMGAQSVTIFSRDLLTPAQAKNLTFEAQANNVGLGWSDFQGRTLQSLIDAVLAIDEQLGRC